jgi:DNA-binding HxlR family transcriptional regulator
MGLYIQPVPELNQEQMQELKQRLKELEDLGFVERVEELSDALKDRLTKTLADTPKG